LRRLQVGPGLPRDAGRAGRPLPHGLRAPALHGVPGGGGDRGLPAGRGVLRRAPLAVGAGHPAGERAARRGDGRAGDRVLREHRERQLLHGGVPLRADPRDAAGRGVLPGDAASRGAAAVRVRVSAVARGRDVPGGHAGPGHPMAAGGARGRPRGVRRPRDRPVGAGVSPEAGALMLTTFVTRSMVSARPVSIGRVTAVMNRNTTVLRSGAAYWLVLLSGVVEPLLYLLSIGVGVGALIGEITVDGRAMPYAWFVGPA